MIYNNKIVAITGGGEGIGRKLGLKYASYGATVIIIDGNEKTGRETVDIIYENNGQGVYIKNSLDSIQSIKRSVESVIYRYGKIDIFIHNVRLTGNEEFYSYTLINEVLEVMKNELCGKIVNIISPSDMIKSGKEELFFFLRNSVIDMTYQFSKDLSDYDIQINCISSGFGDHDTRKRLKEVTKGSSLDFYDNDEDIAKACIYLTREKSQYINGSNLFIDRHVFRKLIQIGQK